MDRNRHGPIQHELTTEEFKACMHCPCVYDKNDSSSKVFVTASSEVGISKTKAFLMIKLAMKDLRDVLFDFRNAVVP